MFKLLLLVLCLVSQQALSAQIEVTDENVNLGDSFYLYAESDGDFSIDGLENFLVISENIKLTEGGQRISKRYHLKSLREGSFHLSSTDGDVEITVTKSQKAPDSFIKVYDIPDKVYQGQKFTLDYHLLTKREIAYAKFRPFRETGFKSKSFHILKEPSKVLDGLRRYEDFFVDRVVFCFEGEEAKIPKRILDLEILDCERFHGHFIPAYLESDELTLRMIPLEKDVKIVGRASVKSDSFEEEGILHVTLSFSGDANFDGLDSLYSSNNDFEVSESVTSSENAENGYFATKTFNISFKPKSEVKIIPARIVDYLDTVDGRYKSLKIGGFSLQQGEEISNLWRLFTKGRNLLWILIVVVLYLLVRFGSAMLLGRRNRDLIIELAESESHEEIVRLLRNEILKQKGVDILGEAELIEREFNEELAEKIKRILSREGNFKKEAIEVIRELRR